MLQNFDRVFKIRPSVKNCCIKMSTSAPHFQGFTRKGFHSRGAAAGLLIGQ